MISKVFNWIKGASSFVIKQAVGAIVTAVALWIGYLIFNDFLAPVPDLSGRWKFTITYTNTENTSFQDLEVTYQALLTQNELTLSGTGEKLSDRGPGRIPINYYGDKRTNIDLTGSFTRRFFTQDLLMLSYKEDGKQRQSSTILRLVIHDDDILCGCFVTTVADTFGPVVWQRISSQRKIYESIDLLKSCEDVVNCTTESVR